MKKIDVHAHFGEWFLVNNSCSVEATLEMMKRWEIERCIFSSSKSVVYEMREGNAELERLLREQDAFYGYIYFDPNHPRESVEEIQRYAQDKKFVGVKSRPSYHGHMANSSECREILKVVEKHGLPWLVHTFTRPFVDSLVEVARDYDIPIIMGHMGAADWRYCVRRAAELENLYYEPCCGVTEVGKIELAIRMAGAERVLFGSDLTLLHPGFSVGMIEGADIAERDKKKIYFENAERIFRF